MARPPTREARQVPMRFAGGIYPSSQLSPQHPPAPTPTQCAYSPRPTCDHESMGWPPSRRRPINTGDRYLGRMPASRAYYHEWAGSGEDARARPGPHPPSVGRTSYPTSPPPADTEAGRRTSARTPKSHRRQWVSPMPRSPSSNQPRFYTTSPPSTDTGGGRRTSPRTPRTRHHERVGPMPRSSSPSDQPEFYSISPQPAGTGGDRRTSTQTPGARRHERVGPVPRSSSRSNQSTFYSAFPDSGRDRQMSPQTLGARRHERAGPMPKSSHPDQPTFCSTYPPPTDTGGGRRTSLQMPRPHRHEWAGPAPKSSCSDQPTPCSTFPDSSRDRRASPQMPGVCRHEWADPMPKSSHSDQPTFYSTYPLPTDTGGGRLATPQTPRTRRHEWAEGGEDSRATPGPCSPSQCTSCPAFNPPTDTGGGRRVCARTPRAHRRERPAGGGEPRAAPSPCPPSARQATYPVFSQFARASDSRGGGTQAPNTFSDHLGMGGGDEPRRPPCAQQPYPIDSDEESDCHSDETDYRDLTEDHSLPSPLLLEPSTPAKWVTAVEEWCSKPSGMTPAPLGGIRYCGRKGGRGEIVEEGNI